jgi:hypothetical protein
LNIFFKEFKDQLNTIQNLKTKLIYLSKLKNPREKKTLKSFFLSFTSYHHLFYLRRGSRIIVRWHIYKTRRRYSTFNFSHYPHVLPIHTSAFQVVPFISYGLRIRVIRSETHYIFTLTKIHILKEFTLTKIHGLKKKNLVCTSLP